MTDTPKITEAARAHDMSRFWRVFTYQCGRINGTFVVMAAKDGVHHVNPFEVTVYADDAHSWGRVLYSRDLTAFFKNGAVDIPKHMISEAVRADVEDAWGDLVAAIEACIAAWSDTVKVQTEPPAEDFQSYVDHLGVDSNPEHDDSEWWAGYRQAQRDNLRAAVAAVSPKKGQDQ